MARGIMSNEVFEKVLENLSKYKEEIEIIVLYHGGEPLLNKSLFEMICAIKKIKPFFVKIVSNGMLLNESKCKQLLATPLDLIEFSLDGLDESENQQIRINSSTSVVINNISFFLKLRKELAHPVKVAISTTQFLNNDKLKIISADKEIQPEIPQWLLEVFEDAVDEFKPTYAMLWPHMNVSNDFEVREVNGVDLAHCDHINSTMTIRADGTIVPCCYDLTTQLPMGNILLDDLKELFMGGGSYTQLRTAIATKSYPSLCANCNVVRPNKFLIPKWR